MLSSGRAGSTLLARMIQSHPELLCVSDLFEPVGEEPYFDRARVVSGREFFAILSRPSYPQRIAYWRQCPTAELLFLHPEDEMVSLLTSYTLPFLTGGDPMALYEEAGEEVARWGEAPIADHLVAFFDWLRDRFWARRWVERTGGSLPHARRILEVWPDAKVVHNYRDTREVAISMLTGSFFRLYLELERDPDLGEWDWTYTPPVEELAAMVNRWVVDAAAALAELPAEQRMDLAYEELVTRPAETLLALSGFLLDRAEPSVGDRAWAERQARIVRRVPLRFPGLEEPEQQRLQAACGEALATLGYL